MRRCSLLLTLVSALTGGCGADEAVATLDVWDDSPRPELGPPPPDPPVVRRLTRREYIATLRAAIPPKGLPTVEAELWRLPPDVSRDGFDTMDIRLTADHVEAWIRVSEVAATAVRESLVPELLKSKSCGASSEADCVRAVALRVGEPAFRRALKPDELVWLESLYGASAAEDEADPVGAGVEAVAFAIFNAPAFLYRLELDSEESPGASTAVVTDTELASRIALALTGSPPSASLAEAARAGFPTDTAVEDAAKTLFETPLAREVLWTFFSGWLTLDAMPELQFPRQFFPMDLVNGLRETMALEMRDLVLHLAFEAPGAGYDELMSTTTGFYESEGLASVYEIAEPAAERSPVELDPVTRSGILTRAALLLQLGQYTSPVRRGAFVKRRLLCEDIALPPATELPPDALVAPPQDPGKTTRQRWTEATSSPTCRACHDGFNALGFVMEKYDSIGRYRETEYTMNIMFTDGQNLPIDDTASVTLDDVPVTITGATGLGTALASSPKARRCLAQQWFRFSMGRRETGTDKDSIDALAGALDTGGIAAMVLRTVTTRAFRERVVPPLTEIPQ